MARSSSLFMELGSRSDTKALRSRQVDSAVGRHTRSDHMLQSLARTDAAGGTAAPPGSLGRVVLSPIGSRALSSTSAGGIDGPQDDACF